ncbi:VOC family protein [Nocardioides perillae]|uniref:Putative enzyme related to lactoylglutathione lyase n=1 Tax=Nocardioides perillae TaxID=1119534 RepID=A0A7Y9RT86_9ACTN|nr:VOC family protein [Nocardioides perillae]NYG54233.1 putative enzyme related to lactoylglutathione lyase [Nocardioides perillae]
MTMHVHNITVDATDALGLATFWSRLLGWHVFHDDDPEVVVAPHFPYAGTGMLFIPVPEGKTAKNRLHVDVAPDDETRDEAVARAEGLGARVLADHRRDDGTGWVVMADPEGNEFCVERGPHEKGPLPPQTWRLG